VNAIRPAIQYTIQSMDFSDVQRKLEKNRRLRKGQRKGESRVAKTNGEDIWAKK